MARERYLRNNPDEDTIHSDVIKLKTKREIFLNWLYYAKWRIFAVAVLIAIVFYVVFTLVTVVRADYQVALLDEYYYEEGVIELMEEYIEQYAYDLNGDGEVVVELVSYTVADYDEDDPYSYYDQLAFYTTFTADVSDGSSMIWLHTEDAFIAVDGESEDMEYFFTQLSDVETIDEDGKIAYISEYEALANLDFSSYDSYEEYGDLMIEIWESHRISVRGTVNTVIEGKKEDEMAEALALVERLRTDTKLTTEEQFGLE